MNDPIELASKFFENVTDELYCTLPCQVVAVNGNYVDVKVFINDNEPDMILYHVPIQREETNRAYIFLGIKQGDRGTLKFFDRSVEGYLQSDFDYNSDDRQHDISDRAFELGFIPDKEAFVYPTNADIELGLKSGTVKMTFTESGIAIVGNVTVTGDLTVTGEVTGNSIPLSQHKHLGVTTGNSTSGLPTV